MVRARRREIPVAKGRTLEGCEHLYLVTDGGRKGQGKREECSPIEVGH